MGIGYHTSHFLYTPSHMQRDKSYEIDEKKKETYLRDFLPIIPVQNRNWFSVVFFPASFLTFITEINFHLKKY